MSIHKIPGVPTLYLAPDPDPGFCETCEEPLDPADECVNCDRTGGDCA